MWKVLSVVFVFCFCISNVDAQFNKHQWTCGSDMLSDIDNPYGPSPKSNMRYFDKKWSEKSQNQAKFSVPEDVVIPVVFHIVHKNGPENISDEQVEDAVEFLNQSFANVAPYDPSGFNTQIQFCLAQQDPDGNSSSGITRVVSDLTSMTMEIDDSDLKSLTNWPTTCYVNVWLVNSITSVSSGPGVAGYATFPGSHGMFNDGIVMESNFAGTSSGDNAVLTHEMGHYFGLYHTFQGACTNNDCTQDGDKVCDTPPDQSTAYIPCNSTMNTCDTDANSGFPSDQDDLFQNFMDYSELPCYYLFTEGQIDRMHLAISEVRSSLLSCPSCILPCEFPVTADFTLSPNPAQLNENITATNTSTNAVSYEWYVNGAFYSSDASPVFNFSSEGIYKILLIAQGSESECLDQHEIVIDVNCNLSLDVSPSLTGCYSPDSLINFSFNDFDAVDINWYINDMLVSTDPMFSWTFEAGVHKISIEASNGQCSVSGDFYTSFGCNEICGNGFDDDGDGLIDCYDPDCCEECDDFYFDACFEAAVCPIDFDDFGITEKWKRDVNGYEVFNMIGGDVDNNGTSEVLMFTFFGGAAPLSLIDSEGDEIYPLFEANQLNGNMGPAMMDADGDGSAEIYYIDFDYKLNCMALDGTKLFQSAQPFTTFFSSLGTIISVADLNYDGNPEVVIGNDVYDGLTGDLLVLGDDSQYSRGLMFAVTTDEGHVVTANILDDDTYPGLEIVTGNMVLTVDLDNGTLEKPVVLNGYKDGAAAVADWDRDGDLDVISICSKTNEQLSKRLVVWEGQTNDILYEITTDIAFSSTPTVLNLDDDPELEVVVSHRQPPILEQSMVAYENDLSVKWTHVDRQLTHCPAIGFDFNGDGKNHVIARSQVMEVLDGNTGEILFDTDCYSITNNEHPIVLDIDNDGHAEIVTVCDGEPTAFEGFPQEWAPSRTMWHQYYFNNTLINDDLTLPLVQQQIQKPNPNQGLNTSMTAYAALKKSEFYDFNVFDLDYVCTDNGILINLSIEYLRGVTLEDKLLPYSIYNGDPSDPSTEIYTTTNIVFDNSNLPELGDTIYHNWFIPINDLDVFGDLQMCIVANDPGTMLPFNYENDVLNVDLVECRYEDNYFCLNIVELQIDLLEDELNLCSLDSLVLNPDGTYSMYLWNDGSTDSVLSVFSAGEYWVEITNECGLTVRDTISVEEITNNLSLDLGPDQTVCVGGVASFEADDGFDKYIWQDGTDNQVYTAWLPGKYWVTAYDACGQTKIDTIELLMTEVTMDLIDTINLCEFGNYGVTADDFVQLLVDDEDFPNCDDCNSVSLDYTMAGWVYLIGIDENGCAAEDSVFINLTSYPIVFDTAVICEQFYVFRDTIFESLGDHVYQDDVSFCDTTFNIFLLENTAINVGYDYEITCDPLGATLNLDIQSDSNYELEWEDGSDGLIRTNLQGGTYELTITDEYNCETYWIETFNNLEDFDYSIQDTFEIDINQPVELTVDGDTILADIDWAGYTMPCDTCFANTIYPEVDTWINITVIDENGCEKELRTFIRVITERDYYLGNIFSPNEDGLNDKFYLQDGDHIEKYQLAIYDRWGSKVFDGVDLLPNVPDQGWDGRFNDRQVITGVYAFVVEVTFLNGTEVRKFGSVTIVR